MLNMASRTRSLVGRITLPLGTVINRRLNCPDMMRIRDNDGTVKCSFGIAERLVPRDGSPRNTEKSEATDRQGARAMPKQRYGEERERSHVVCIGFRM